MNPRPVLRFLHERGYASVSSVVSLIVSFFAVTCGSAVRHRRTLDLLYAIAIVLALVWAILLAWTAPAPEVLGLLIDLIRLLM